MVFSKTGAAAKMVFKYKPPCPVIVVSSDDHVLRECSLLYGCFPFKQAEVTDIVKSVVKALKFAG